MTTTDEARALAAAEMVAAEWRAENNRLRTALAVAEADAAAARLRVRELEALIAAQVAAAVSVVTVPSGVGKTYWPPRDGLSHDPAAMGRAVLLDVVSSAAHAIAATDALRQEHGFDVTCGPSRAAIMVAERMEDLEDARVIALVVLSLWQRRAFELHPEAFKDRPDA